jgi:uncharacterized protein with von Willebrand factor type A (vWA) domain
MRERGPVVTARLAILVSAMRAGGVKLGIGDLIGAHRALAAVDASSRTDSYLALRAALCSRRDHYEVFDAAFEATFGSRREPRVPIELAEAGALALPRIGVPAGESEQRAGDIPFGEQPVPAAWSDVELLREKDFAELTDAERAVARRLVRRIAVRGPLKRSRRTRTARHRGAHPHGARSDLRSTVRASLRYGGEPVERHWREPASKQRPVVLVCDVSGSMEPYARMLLQYMQAWVAARRRVEAFVFGTRLTRVTKELAGRDPDAAVTRAAGAVADWSGGTRIGDSLASLNRRHGRRIGRGSVIVVLSDGWDRGDPDQLADEMARLSRCAYSVVWLNPLKAHPGYEPLTRGMTAALPFVDHFLAGNSLASLEQLADLMEEGLE